MTAVLTEAVIAALEKLDIPGGVHDAAPERAAYPHAFVDIGPVSDWGNKSGAGREARIAVTIADKGRSAARLHGLMNEAEGAVSAVGAVSGWSLVSLRFLRSRVARDRDGRWAGVIEFRARMLAA
ncbi:tail completion protein gp17 [Allosphingosinicella vermicomposti]|uniref:tail completion protein gp17 n=1 Tax=Allosphingosinicella vermicomposti TaxID=614671 RepID=UPI00131A5600|nr:DUF3168 domain-containing protein [Allosphingosinicella vermicomposti]